MSVKEIKKIVAPGRPHFVGDGFRVVNYIPGENSMAEYDPFIMLDYNPPYEFTPRQIPRGVGVHPHKGFETVTIAYQGKVEHGDSHGGGGIIEEGDVQWMTAASGILHKEFHEKEWSKKGGVFQMVQLWVNLPAKNKSEEPVYQYIKNSDQPKVKLENDAGEVEVIAGEYKGIKGAAKTFTTVHLFNAKLNSEKSAKFNFPHHYTTGLVVINGAVEVNNEVINKDHFVFFEKEGEELIIKALEDSVVLLLSGEPINEPIAAHGPFVMNTKEEILEAFEDFNTGKFGYLED